MRQNRQYAWLCVKAAVIATAASMALVARDAGSSEPSAQSYKNAMSQLEETYRLDIHEADAPFTIQSNSEAIRGCAVHPGDLEKYIPLFARELFLYPPEFVEALKLRRIVLITEG